MTPRTRELPVEGVRDRFLKLEERHGREALAEHIGLRLGWDKDARGRRQEPMMYRRGVLVLLGLTANRHGGLNDRMPLTRARQVHDELDRVEAGAPLERERAEAVAPGHREAVGAPARPDGPPRVRHITKHRRAIA